MTWKNTFTEIKCGYCPISQWLAIHHKGRPDRKTQLTWAIAKIINPTCGPLNHFIPISLSQYSWFHHIIPFCPSSVQLRLCISQSSLFNHTNFSAFSLILIIFLFLDQLLFLLLWLVSFSGSRSSRSKRQVPHCIRWMYVGYVLLKRWWYWCMLWSVCTWNPTLNLRNPGTATCTATCAHPWRDAHPWVSKESLCVGEYSRARKEKGESKSKRKSKIWNKIKNSLIKLK